MPSIPYIWYKISLATNNGEQGEEFVITLGTMSGELSMQTDRCLLNST